MDAASPLGIQVKYNFKKHTKKQNTKKNYASMPFVFMFAFIYN